MKNCDEIVHDLLERREEYMKLKKQRTRRMVIAGSSVLCAFTIVFLIGFSLRKTADSVRGDKNTAINSASNDKKSKEDKKVADNQKTDDKIMEEQYAVYTNKVILPKDMGEDVACDMIGCLYYNGSVYTQTETYYDEETERVKKLLGKKIGEANGKINEWSTQEEYTTEFASTYTGSVYKVKGYSEDFRLCVYDTSYESRSLVILDNYDGIGLNTGSDLFEKRLHLTGNVNHVTYQTHEDWNGDGEGKEREKRFKELKITEKEWDEFITELYYGPFQAIDYQKEEGFYDKEPQGHLYLQMKDGTEVEMRLFDGGYAGCQGLGWYMVKMPGEIFDKIMEACQN